jgi:glycine/D-amino acid oxidase-like deaminating enzyme
MPTSKSNRNWATPPWKIDFEPPVGPVPSSVDLAIIGGGFTGLAAAAWLRRLAPEKSVVLLEASRIGAGASGRTGGIVLAETAAGDLPGLGDVLKGFREILQELAVDCELELGGAWEIAHGSGSAKSPAASSPIDWNDSGSLRVVNEVSGGTLDPGKLVSGLARSAAHLGAVILENSPVKKILWGAPLGIEFGRKGARPGKISAEKILFATNALSLELTGLVGKAEPRLTLAALTAPLGVAQLTAIGLAQRKPFYTVDLPYLWGRVRRDNSIVWGAGLVNAPDERNLESVDIGGREPAALFAKLEQRVRGLHPSLAAVAFTHRWGGPILFCDDWRPVFTCHPESSRKEHNAIVLGAFAGHGVALSTYLGAWAAETLLGQRDLPPWGSLPHR